MHYIILYLISEKCDFYTKIKLKQVNNFFYSFIEIKYLPSNLVKKIKDKDLLNLVNLRKLDLRYNQNITDEGLKNLVNIRELHLWYNQNITDEGRAFVRRTNKHENQDA